MDKKNYRDMRNYPATEKKENRNVYFCITYSRYFSMSIHMVISSLKNSSNLSCLWVQMYYYIFNNLYNLINGDFTRKSVKESSPFKKWIYNVTVPFHIRLMASVSTKVDYRKMFNLSSKILPFWS